MDEPVIETADQYIYGDEVTISCKAEGNPAPVVSWTKDGKSFVPIAGSGSSEWRVTFNPISYSDTGYYTCIAKNAAGELTSSHDIIVDGQCWVKIMKNYMHAIIWPDKPNSVGLLLICEVYGPDCGSKLFLYKNPNGRKRYIVIQSDGHLTRKICWRILKNTRSQKQ